MGKTTIKEAEQKFHASATSDFNYNLLALLRSNQELIHITTTEEQRLLDHVENLCIMRGCKGFIWDCYKGLRSLDADRTIIAIPNVDPRNPELMLNHIISVLESEQKKRREEDKKNGNNNASKQPGPIYVLLDFYRYLNPPNPAIQRRLKYLATECKMGSIIMTGPSYFHDSSLDKDVAVLDFPYPNEYEINQVLDDALSLASTSVHFQGVEQYVNANREKIVGAVKGLNIKEAQAAFYKSMVMARQLGHNPFDLNILIREKRAIIRKTDILEYIDPTVSLDDVGGLENLTAWLADRKLAFTHEAKEYGLNMPRGILLIGVPGGGKSLTAKAVAKDYGMTLIRWDFGRMFDSLVGESERTARSAIKLAETVAPCVSGSSNIYDANGKAHTIENLLENTAEIADEPFYIFAFNETTNRVERTQVQAVVRQPEKKEMLRIKTAHSTIEVTKDHKVMVNRNGGLQWLAASEIAEGDLVMSPKFFFRNKSGCEWKKAITVKYDYFRSDVNRNEPPVLVASLNGEEQVVHLASGWNASKLYYLVGMLDGAGWIDAKSGIIHFAANDWEALLAFARGMSNFFMLEPEVSGTKRSSFFADTNNKIAADILLYALDHLFAQDDEAIGSYLSGFLDASGSVVPKYKDEKTIGSVIFSVTDPVKRQRVKKALHVFGILAPKETKRQVSISSYFDIEAVAYALNSEVEQKAAAIYCIMAGGGNTENKDVGYKLGQKLASDRKALNLSKEDFGSHSSLISRYEKDKIIPHERAWNIAEVLQNKMEPQDAQKLTVADLVCSDLIGVRVVSIEEIGEQWAYDLACRGNHNFFANDILCHNCVLWVDEIDKGLSGGVGAGSGDSGTTKRVLSTFLTWLQEKTEPVFVVATANNVLDIPPEFMRAGRFDEVFFVDLPGQIGRRQIFSILLQKRGREIEEFDLDQLVAATGGYSGAEIEKAIEAAMFLAFKDGKRPFTDKDIVAAANRTKPLSVTRKADLLAMREWAAQHCTFANTDQDELPSSV